MSTAPPAEEDPRRGYTSFEWAIAYCMALDLCPDKAEEAIAFFEARDPRVPPHLRGQHLLPPQ